MTRARALLMGATIWTAAVVSLAIVATRAGGLRCTYFDGPSWDRPVRRATSDVATDQVMADAPSVRKPFSVEWSGFVYSSQTEQRSLIAASDGISSIFVDGRRVFEHREGQPDFMVPATLTAGVHSIFIRYAHTDAGQVHVALLSAPANEPLRSGSLALSPARYSPVAYEASTLVRWLAAVTLAIWSLAALLWLASRIQRTAFFSVLIATVVLMVCVVYDSPSWLRGPAPYPEEWQWAYQIPVTTGRIWPAVLAASALLALLFALPRLTRPRSVRTRARLGLIGAVIGGVLFQLALLHFEPEGALAALTQRTLSDDITSYFTVAATYPSGVREFLRTYAAEMPRRDRHATSHPPGPILYHRAVIATIGRMDGLGPRILDWLERHGTPRAKLSETGRPSDLALASALVGSLGILLCAALTAWPLSVVARAMGATPLVAVQFAVLWEFCPGPALFAPQFDQVLTLLVTSACALGCQATSARPGWRRFAASFSAGLLAGASVFCSFGAPPMLAMGALVVWVLTPHARRTIKDLSPVALTAVAGFVLALAVPITLGYEFLTTTREGLAVSRYSYEIKRNYWVWLRFNLLDFGLFLGPPIVIWGLVSLVQRLRQKEPAFTLRLDVLAAVAGCLLLLDVSGVIRGEVARIWMPFMPLAFLALAPVLPAARSQPYATRTESATVAAQLFLGALLAIVCVVLRLYWNPA